MQRSECRTTRGLAVAPRPSSRAAVCVLTVSIAVGPAAATANVESPAAVPAVSSAVSTSSPVGLWKTIDDKTGQPRGLVRIYAEGGVLFAKIEESLAPGPHLKTCEACRDERKGQPMVGLLIMRNMQFRDGVYDGGDILDPENGNVYRCKLTLDADGKGLTVRGYIGLPLVGRSQRWLRADSR